MKYKDIRMKKIYYTLGVIFNIFVNAQIGINSASPKTSFDISQTVENQFPGLIAPNVTATYLSEKNYTVDQDGAIVYVTELVTNPTNQISEINSTGHYFYSAEVNKWQKLLIDVGDGEPWMVQGSDNVANQLSQDIYHQGKVFVGEGLTTQIMSEKIDPKTKFYKEGSFVSGYPGNYLFNSDLYISKKRNTFLSESTGFFNSTLKNTVFSSFYKASAGYDMKTSLGFFNLYGFVENNLGNTYNGRNSIISIDDYGVSFGILHSYDDKKQINVLSGDDGFKFRKYYLPKSSPQKDEVLIYSSLINNQNDNEVVDTQWKKILIKDPEIIPLEFSQQFPYSYTIYDPGRGIIMHSPNGSLYLVTVNDDGSLLVKRMKDN